MAEAKQFTLKITSAVGIAGKLKRAGSIVTLDEAAAKNLMQRGKAVLPTDAELRAAGFEVVEHEPAGSEVLYGSNKLPAMVKIAKDKEVQLGEVVAAAHTASGLSVEDWNALEEDKRDELLTDQIKTMRAEAKSAAAK